MSAIDYENQMEEYFDQVKIDTFINTGEDIEAVEEEIENEKMNQYESENPGENFFGEWL